VDYRRVAEIAKNTHPKPEVHRFWAEMHAPDWIQLFLLIVAIGALIFSAIATRQNSRAVTEAGKGRDTENYLKLWRNSTKPGQSFRKSSPKLYSNGAQPIRTPPPRPHLTI